MNFPSVTLYKETLPKNPQVSAGKTRRSKWGKTVSDVTSRRDISYSAKVLFNAFSEHGKGQQVVALSQVFLAAAIGGDRGTVQIALKSLEGVGLIEKLGLPEGREQIQSYRMLHPALIRGEQTEAIRAARPNLRKCPKCSQLGVLRKTTGWCLRCTKDVELDGRIRRTVNGELSVRGIVAKGLRPLADDLS